MVIFDVTTLYMNISRELGKQAISFGIEKYLETLYIRFNKKFITDDIELTPNNNSLQFNHKIISKPAVGTKMARTYTTLSKVVKLATIVEGNPKAPFSIATTPR